MNLRATLRRWALGPVGIAFLIAIASSCQGNGCACLTPIPGGFPANARTANAAQVRVSSTGIAKVAADPQALVGALAGAGGLSFSVPSSCGGTPAVCCPGGNPQSPCGPVVIDLAAQPGDQPRLEVTPVQGASRVDVIMRARVHTAMDLPVNVFGLNCGLKIDTAPGANPDLKIAIPVALNQDGTAATTRIDVATVTITQLDSQDLKLTGNIACQGVGGLLGLFTGTITTTFADAIKSAISGQTCKACPGGTKDECGPFATACTNNVCQEGNQCLEELGVTGRLAGSAVFGGLSPGTTGSIDLYEVAGGYATTDQGGIALGLLGGMLPSGAPRDRCGPPATAPAPATIPQSTFFQGNTRPDTSAPFDIAIGVHQDQLDRFAYSAYDGGFLCLTVGTRSVALINSDTFGLFLRSLSNLTSGDAVPMALGIRPQRPPTIALGKNTFIDDGSGGKKLGEPLLDIHFTGLEIDVFAELEGQYVRLFTLVSDLHLPVGLQVDATGKLTPVLGDLTSAFTNLSVKNSEPMLETPDELAAVFPMLLQLALPQLAGGLGAFQVPTVGGLQISVTDITSVDNDKFLAIFGALAPAQMAKPGPRVATAARLVAVHAPATAVFADARAWRADRRPTVEVALGGDDPDQEWALRIDGGLWTAWSGAAQRTIASDLFWLQGAHQIEVIARHRGQPLTADLTPAVIAFDIDTVAPVATIAQDGDLVELGGRDAVSGDRLTARWRFAGEAAWHAAAAPVQVALGGRALADLEVQIVDAAGNVAPTRGTQAIARTLAAPGGCACSSSGGGGGAGLLAILVILALVLRGRARRAVAVVVIGGSLGACSSCSNAPCGSKDCLPGEVTMGAIGRWNSAAADSARAVATTYDQVLGDLVLVELKAGAEPAYSVIDGAPADPPTYDPGTYRGGVADPGPDVGAWSSVALAGGLVRVAYVDRERHALRFAAEDGHHRFAAHDVDLPVDAEQLGQYTSLAIRADGAPAIAYIATGVAAADGTRTTELRLARATTAAPQSGADWAITTIATGVTTCAGMCGSDKCVAGVATGDPAVCAAPTADCTPACAAADICVAGACRAEVTNEVHDPEGVGLYAHLLVMPDGRLAIVHHADAARTLVLELETAAGAGTFAETVVDGGGALDRGTWASAVVDATGVIHVAYQDALGDQLFYTTIAAAPGTPELVDDGVRTGDRTHNIGAGAAIFLVGGAPRIAYQDGTAADLVIATRGGAGWTHADLATGPIVDGLHIAAPAAGGWLVWDALDKNREPASGLSIKQDP